MEQSEQSKGQSVLDHGVSVRNYLFDLLSHLRDNSELKYPWILPEWVKENKKLILDSLPDDETLELYTIYHDCGKPFCLEIDNDGKRHFPNHAEVSYQTFQKYSTNLIAANLIRHDMDIHLLKGDGIDMFMQNDHPVALLIAGLSEIHSNASMFGGTDSTSFKIKCNSINQRGKQIINKIKI